MKKIINIILGITLILSLCGNIYLIKQTQKTKEQVEAYSSSIITANEQITNLQESLADFEDLQEQVADLQVSLDQSNKQIENLENSLAESDTQLENLNITLEEKISQINSLESLIEENNITIASLEDQLAETQKKPQSASTQQQPSQGNTGNTGQFNFNFEGASSGDNIPTSESTLDLEGNSSAGLNIPDFN